MRGALPKPPGARQRRNKEVKVALSAEASQVAPPLPDGTEWHQRTLAWWRDVWASPMSGQYLAADVEGLYRLALLVDAFWGGNIGLASEIRLHQQAYGLTPMDRLRLKWEIVKTEDAEKKRKPEGPTRVYESREILRGVS